jgi:hypothetical protein
MELEFDLDGPVGVVLGFDPQAVLFRGFAQDPLAVDVLDVRSARVSWTQKGRHRLAVLMTPRTEVAAAIDLEILAGAGPSTTLRVDLPGAASR